MDVVQIACSLEWMEAELEQGGVGFLIAILFHVPAWRSDPGPRCVSGMLKDFDSLAMDRRDLLGAKVDLEVVLVGGGMAEQR